MEPTDVTIQILRDIRSELRGVNERLDVQGKILEQHGERLAAVETGVVHLVQRADATNETLGIMNERLGFFEGAATAASEARGRLDERMDRIEQRMDALENRDH